jgi:parallel beta-helix repeat protein
MHSRVIAQRDTTIYVDANYTGSIQNGSSANPYKTIRQALDRRAQMGVGGMTTNEQIIVKSGTYYPTGTDMIIINRTNCGNNGKWLTIKSDVPFEATIRGDSLYKTRFASIVTFTDSAQYVKLMNFTIEKIRNNPDSTRWKNTDGTYTATQPTVMAMYNGQPVRTAYGDTVYEAQKDVKFGIQVASDCRHLNIFDNDISDISWTSLVNPFTADGSLTEAQKKIVRNAWPSDNCGPLNILGTDYDAMKDITVDGNEIHHCIPGWTEGVTVNGYVDTFQIINNLIHDIKNIGIVAAGNFGWVIDPANGFHTPASQNYSRNGIISDNIVYNCISPIAASAGIYLDGARNVLVERNQVYNNHVGISVGNETASSHSGGHTIRNNIVYDNTWTGIVLGSNAYNAWVENVKVLNNTFYRNNSRAATLLPAKDANGLVIIQNGIAQPEIFGDGGEIITQRLSNSSDAPGAKIVFQNNILRSRKGSPVTALAPFKTDAYSSASLTVSNIKNLLDWNYNLYYIEPGYNNSINYDFASAGFTGNTYNFVNYKNTVGLDSASVAPEYASTPSPDPVFVDGTGFPGRYALVSGSLAYNIGNPSSPNSGSDDFIYNTRIQDGRIDAGALEYSESCSGPSTIRKKITMDVDNSCFLFPNPVSDQLTIQLNRKTNDLAQIEFFDITGRMVSTRKVQLNKGANLVRINNFRAAGFVSGSYLVKISTATGSQTFKVLLQ